MQQKRFVSYILLLLCLSCKPAWLSLEAHNYPSCSKCHGSTTKNLPLPTKKIYPYAVYTVIDELKQGVIVNPGIFYPDKCMRIVATHLSLIVEEGDRILVIGTQTGIMGLVAAKFGAKQLIATDTKSAAVKNAKENSIRLGFSNIFHPRVVKLDSEDPAFNTIAKEEMFDIIIFHEDCSGALSEEDKYKLLTAFADGFRNHLAIGSRAFIVHDPSPVFKAVVKEKGLTVTLIENTAGYGDNSCGIYTVK